MNPTGKPKYHDMTHAEIVASFVANPPRIGSWGNAYKLGVAGLKGVAITGPITKAAYAAGKIAAKNGATAHVNGKGIVALHDGDSVEC